MPEPVAEGNTMQQQEEAALAAVDEHLELSRVSLTWEEPPTRHWPDKLTGVEIAAALRARPNVPAIVARHDRKTRGVAHAERVNSGREFGPGFEAEHWQVGGEHRVYVRYTGVGA
ncbi:hypothetical protein [Actinoplanes sp. URMC 104]|uniref:hypothetical protein n=1 Tax=Actinoplanes sp. URMC 104 TaxID=3423409 RepID=UPI003F1A2450